MKSKLAALLAVALLAAAPLVLAQDQSTADKDKPSTGDAMKSDVKKAAKDTGHATKTAAKDTEKGTKTAAKDTAKGTKVAAKDTEKGAKVVGKDTEKAADKTGSEVKKGVDKLKGNKSTDAKPATTNSADTPK